MISGSGLIFNREIDEGNNRGIVKATSAFVTAVMEVITFG